MGADYIPEKDYRAGYWMKNFSRRLAEHAELYRTTPEDAAQIAEAVYAYRTALRDTHTPGVISSPLIRIKNDARKSAERLVRAAAQRIRTDRQIDASLKIEIGLNPGRKRRRRIPPPESSPTLIVSMAMTGIMTIEVIDSETSGKARPRAAMGLELYERIRPRAVVDASKTQQEAEEEDGPANVANVPAGETPTGWRFVGVFTATPIRMYPSSNNGGDEVSVVARWITRRGQPGPFGQPRSIRTLLGLPPRLATLHRDRHTLAA